MDPISNLLEEAEFDSGGRFTLDFAASRKRWEQQALGDPAAFLRLALQALVARDCASIQVRTDTQACRLSWEGKPLKTEELTHLCNYFQGQSDTFSGASLQLLKLAGMLTSCRPDLETRISSAGGVLHLDHQRGAHFEKAQAGTSEIRFTRIAQRPKDQLSSVMQVDLLHPFLSSAWPEIAQLTRGFGDLSSPVSWNGKSGEGNLLRTYWDDNLGIFEVARCAVIHPDPERNRLRMSFSGNNPLQKVFAPSLFSCTDTQGKVLEVKSGDTVRCCLAALLYNRGVVHGKQNSPNHQFRWMLNGWPVDRPQLGIPPMRIVVDASNLPTDITGARLADSSRLRELTRSAWSWLAENLKAACRNLDEQSHWTRLRFWSQRDALARACNSLEVRLAQDQGLSK